MRDRIGPLERADRRDAPDAAERASMVASAMVALVVFSYMAWQAVVLPDAPVLSARVLDVATTEAGVEVRVEVRNDGGVGLRAVEVSVDCAERAPALTFENVPASGRRAGVLVCPAGTAAPTASVTSWIPA